MSPNSAVIISVIVGVGGIWIGWELVFQVRHWRFRRGIYARPCTEEQWRTQFPEAMPIVDRVLTSFCDAFLFHRRYRYHFRPEDSVMHIYKNTTGPLADEMQLEKLTLELRESFGIELVSSFHEKITLCDIAKIVLARGSDAEST